MANAPDDLRPIDPHRTLGPDERALVDQLLATPFEGRDEIRSQFAVARVEAQGSGATRTLRFTCGGQDVPRAPTRVRIPVEAEVLDTDRIPISVLLHVVDGLAEELKIYRVDGAEIQRHDRRQNEAEREVARMNQLNGKIDL